MSFINKMSLAGTVTRHKLGLLKFRPGTAKIRIKKLEVRTSGFENFVEALCQSSPRL